MFKNLEIPRELMIFQNVWMVTSLNVNYTKGKFNMIGKDYCVLKILHELEWSAGNFNKFFTGDKWQLLKKKINNPFRKSRRHFFVD